MPFDMELEDGYMPWHLPGTSDLELHQALARVHRARQQLADIELTLELLEGASCGARAST